MASSNQKSWLYGYPVSGRVVLLSLLLSAACLTALAQQSPLSGKLIRKITIEGLAKTPESELLGRLGFRIGERYNPEAVELEAARLFALGKFKRVLGPYESKYEDGVAIRFVVEEKPLVFKISYQGLQSGAITENDLLTGTPSLRVLEGDLFNEYMIRQDIQGIRKKYLDKGFLFVEIDHTVETTSRGVEINFRIFEGTQVGIEDIRFRGNDNFSESELLAQMTSKERKFWLLDLIMPTHFSPKNLQADIGILKKFYRQHGFRDVQIETQSVELRPGKEGVDIEILVREGDQYTFEGYTFTGNSVFSDQVIFDLTTSITGTPFNQKDLQGDQDAILNYYKDRAYLFAKVTPKFVHSLDKPALRIEFNIEENNEIYINKIKIKGNLMTQDRVIRRELEFYPGEKIDNSRLVKSKSNINRLGLFPRVDYIYEPTLQPAYRDITVNVSELPRYGSLMLGFGLSQGYGVFGQIQFTKRNFDILDTPESVYDLLTAFTGAGQSLTLRLSPGTVWSRYQLTFVEPYLFDTRNSLRLQAQSIKWWRYRWSERYTGFLPNVSHAFDFDRDLRVALGARIESVTVDNIEENAPAAALAAKGNTFIVGLDLGLDYDKAFYHPTAGPYGGHREKLDYKIAGTFMGSDLDYHHITFGQNLYFPVYSQKNEDHHVIALKANVGVIEPFGDTDEIPIFERFFLGGPHTVKGFRHRGLGPHDNGEPIGATAQIWGTAEYSFPVFEQMLRGVAFFDYGNLQNMSDFNFDKMRYVVGAGVRLNFPMLGGAPIPIGLYFGTPLKRQPEDETRFFLFSLGYLF